jgi:hypothetical protein
MNVLLKAKYSFYSALVFFLVANPETYKIVDWMLGGLFGTSLASGGGCPTPLGLFLHTIVFFFVILALMMFPRD